MFDTTARESRGILPFVLATSLVALTACSDDEPEPAEQILRPVDDSAARTFRLVGSEEGGFDGGTTAFANRWNAAGDLVEQRITRSDGSVSVISLRYADGRPVTGEEDTDGDGIVDVRRVYGYDAAGRQISREIDTDLDGVFERGTGWEIDARGLAVATWEPLGCAPSRCASEADEYTRIVHENGRVSRLETDFRESPLDGEADRVVELRYDVLGRLDSLTRRDLDDGGETSGSFVYEEGPCDTDFLNSRFAYFCVTAPAE